MLHNILNSLDKSLNFETASAHCDVPCGIYDPSAAQVAALTVIRIVDLIEELAAKDSLTMADQIRVARLANQKEEHAGRVKDEVNIIWGDFLKAPQFENWANCHDLVHRIMMQGSKCRQGVSRDEAMTLLNLVNEFAEGFWAAKGVATFTATCPYAPAENVVYPKLD
jgi:nickel superoxide dismutase